MLEDTVMVHVRCAHLSRAVLACAATVLLGPLALPALAQRGEVRVKITVQLPRDWSDLELNIGDRDSVRVISVLVRKQGRLVRSIRLQNGKGTLAVDSGTRLLYTTPPLVAGKTYHGTAAVTIRVP